MVQSLGRGTWNRVLGLAAAVALLAGCGGSSSSSPPPAPVLVLIGVSPASPTLAPGAAQQLTATGKYSDATTKDLTSQVTWASTDTDVATVSGGLVTAGALTGGSTVVTASLGEQVGFTQVSVTGAELFAIRLFPTAVSEPIGVGTITHVLGRYTDDTERDITSLTTFTIDDSTLATVTAGKVRGVAAGSTKLAASVGGFSASADVTITSATIDYLVVGPMNAPRVATGRTEGFTAIAEYYDGANYTYYDVTADATWESDDTATVSFATASSPGLATAVAAGSANVTATFDSMTSSPQALQVADGLTDYTETQIPFGITPMADASPVVTGDDYDAPLPAITDFNFSFYGTSYTTDQIYVTTNGSIYFGYDSDWYPDGPYPNGNPGYQTATIYGDDLITSVTYKVLGAAPSRQLVLDWQGIFYSYESEPVHLQMVLHEGTNLIDFQYIAVGAQYGVDAVIGIQNQDGTLGTEHSLYDYLVVPGLAIRYSP